MNLLKAIYDEKLWQMHCTRMPSVICVANRVIKLISGQVVDATHPFVSGRERPSISDDNVRPVDEPGEDSGAAFHRAEIYLSNKC